ncbi:zona pellucida sperm-binding protein 4-like isoform X2 [Engraulis encrasicolus]|uniref:zona pellucida sperm-binding protein 4-like isoform X2 n=1 Tax=Engraulis encrasicolus TaxID=184585 RepID=UPI002FD18AC3
MLGGQSLSVTQVLVVFLSLCHAQYQSWQKPAQGQTIHRNPPHAQQQTAQNELVQIQQTLQQRENNPWIEMKPTEDLSTQSQRCQVEPMDRVQCGEPDVTGAECLEINCCFDGRECFYGLSVTLQCTRDGQFVVVVAKEATLPALRLDSMSLAEDTDESCQPVSSTHAFVIYQFTVSSCGTTMTEDDDYITYENIMSSSYEVGIGPRGSITRDSSYELTMQCRYSSTAVEAVVMEVNTLPPPLPVIQDGPVRVELRVASGVCTTKGCTDDEMFSSFYSEEDYPLTKVLREPIPVEVQILERTDPNIVLLLDHCWATSSPDGDSLPQWDLLIDGCPYAEDRYLTTVVPVDASSNLQYPTHHKRFIVKMFAFVESYVPVQQMVHIHCSTSLCSPSNEDSCEQTCGRKRRSLNVVEDSQEQQQQVVSSGEVIIVEGGWSALNQSQTEEAVHEAVHSKLQQQPSWTLSSVGLLGVITLCVLSISGLAAVAISRWKPRLHAVQV